MDKSLVREFILHINRFDEKEYLLSTIAYGTAPTLKGLKPASLLSFSIKGRNLYRLWGKHKQDACKELGLRFFELKETEDRILVLFYHFEQLEKHISDKKNRLFLKSMGYNGSLPLEQSLQALKNRFEYICPHEIGVFLGIPVEDVCGFIRHKGGKCLFCSYWKVYHEPERALALFQGYDRAKTSVIYSIVNGGRTDATMDKRNYPYPAFS